MSHIEIREDRLVTPTASIEDVSRFRRGVLPILSKIKIASFDEKFKEDVKAVYELLSHLQLDDQVLGTSIKNQNRTKKNESQN